MERKTMGAFIAALRKANGMTQQELADKLNISNKAVSRWERDECAPDITLIPALAEILGVTCDELLKGERILTDLKQEQSEPKIEKQTKAIINRSISKFTMLIWISLALSAVGYVCMLGISYGAFRSIIGFAVMSIFAIAAFVLAAIATTKMQGVKSENELFENADAALINRYNKILGNFSFTALSAVITVVALSLPIVIFAPDNYTYLEPPSYLMCFGLVVFLFGSLEIVLKDKYCLWITKQPHEKTNFKLVLMNSIQLGALVLAGVLYVMAPFYKERNDNSVEATLVYLAYALLAVNAVTFIIFISVCKSDRKKLILPGLRNLLFIIPSALIQLVNSSDFYSYYYNGHTVWKRKDIWRIEYILLILGLILLILVIFELIKKFIRKKTTNKEV